MGVGHRLESEGRPGGPISERRDLPTVLFEVHVMRSVQGLPVEAEQRDRTARMGVYQAERVLDELRDQG